MERVKIREIDEKLLLKKVLKHDSLIVCKLNILSGKVNHPPPERQFAMLKLLNPTEEQRNLFFDLAAQERNEVPADIAETLKDNIWKPYKLHKYNINKSIDASVELRSIKTLIEGFVAKMTVKTDTKKLFSY